MNLYTEGLTPKKTDSSAKSLHKINQAAKSLAAAVAAASTLTATASADTAVTLTKAAAGAGISHVLDGVVVSYSGSPTGGKVQIKEASTTVFEVDITGSGAVVIPVKRKFAANTAFSVVLAAGGSGVIGKVAISNLYTE